MIAEFQAGSTVRARGGRFLVLGTDTIPQGAGEPIRRLRLRALDEPFRNEEICVLHPIEAVEPDEIPELDLSHPGRLARFQLLMDAIRLSLAPGDDRLVSSSRSRIEFEPYQQVPALRALELPRPRLLIADDVGLGKTIEAGLILRELNARRRAARILIVSPASIIEQWRTELASKFGFEFKIFDSEGVAGAPTRYSADPVQTGAFGNFVGQLLLQSGGNIPVVAEGSLGALNLEACGSQSIKFIGTRCGGLLQNA
jgi:hypothetical protein